MCTYADVHCPYHWPKKKIVLTLGIWRLITLQLYLLLSLSLTLSFMLDYTLENIFKNKKLLCDCRDEMVKLNKSFKNNKNITC